MNMIRLQSFNREGHTLSFTKTVSNSF